MSNTPCCSCIHWDTKETPRLAAVLGHCDVLLKSTLAYEFESENCPHYSPADLSNIQVVDIRFPLMEIRQ